MGERGGGGRDGGTEGRKGAVTEEGTDGGSEGGKRGGKGREVRGEGGWDGGSWRESNNPFRRRSLVPVEFLKPTLSA